MESASSECIIAGHDSLWIAAVGTAINLPYLAGFTVIPAKHHYEQNEEKEKRLESLAVPGLPVAGLILSDAQDDTYTHSCRLEQFSWTLQVRSGTTKASLVARYLVVSSKGAPRQTDANPSSDESDTSAEIKTSALRCFEIETSPTLEILSSRIFYSPTVIDNVKFSYPVRLSSFHQEHVLLTFSKSTLEIYVYIPFHSGMHQTLGTPLKSVLRLDSDKPVLDLEGKPIGQCPTNITDVALCMVNNGGCDILIAIAHSGCVTALLVDAKGIPSTNFNVVGIKTALVGPLNVSSAKTSQKDETTHVADDAVCGTKGLLMILENADQAPRESKTFSVKLLLYSPDVPLHERKGGKNGNPIDFAVSATAKTSSSLFDAISRYAQTQEYTGNKGPNGEFIFQKLPWQEVKNKQNMQTSSLPTNHLTASIGDEELESEPAITTLKLPTSGQDIPGWRPIIEEVTSASTHSSTQVASLRYESGHMVPHPQDYCQTQKVKRPGYTFAELVDVEFCKTKKEINSPIAINSIRTSEAEIDLVKPFDFLAQNSNSIKKIAVDHLILYPLRIELTERNTLLLFFNLSDSPLNKHGYCGVVKYLIKRQASGSFSFSYSNIYLTDNMNGNSFVKASVDPVRFFILDSVNNLESNANYVVRIPEEVLCTTYYDIQKPRKQNEEIIVSLQNEKSSKKISAINKKNLPTLEDLLGSSIHSLKERDEFMANTDRLQSTSSGSSRTSNFADLDRIESLLQRLEDRMSWIEKSEIAFANRLSLLEARERNLEKRERAIEDMQRELVERK